MKWAGHKPFHGHTPYELSSSILYDSPEDLPPKTSSGLRAVIVRCLAKLPVGRYQHASEVGAALSALRSGDKPIKAAMTSVPAAPAVSRMRQPWGFIVGVSALVVLLIAAWAFLAKRRQTAVGTIGAIHSLAVLPLENMSGDPSQEFFAEGMTDELTTELAQISALRVISRTSVMPYRDSKKSLPEIAKELRVDAVVEGSVMRSGDRVNRKD
jgi:hypothetical protein